MRAFICYLITVVCIVLTLGTYGAVETESISGHTGMTRCIVFIAIAFIALIVNRNLDERGF